MNLVLQIQFSFNLHINFLCQVYQQLIYNLCVILSSIVSFTVQKSYSFSTRLLIKCSYFTVFYSCLFPSWVLGSWESKRITWDFSLLKLTTVYKPTCWCLLSGVCTFLFFWPFLMACGILGPWPEVEPMPSAVKAQGCNLWTTREFPGCVYFCTVVASVFGCCWPLRKEVRGKSHFYQWEHVKRLA